MGQQRRCREREREPERAFGVLRAFLYARCTNAYAHLMPLLLCGFRRAIYVEAVMRGWACTAGRWLLGLVGGDDCLYLTQREGSQNT